MLYQSFLHLPGVGEQEERRLWSYGVKDWWDFLAEESLPGLSPGRLSRLKDKLRRTVALLDEPDALARIFPKRHHWRLYRHLRDRALFLDIETNGLARDQAQITVIGLARAGEYRAYIAGEDLEEALPIISSASVIITFGGAHFDLPFLQAKYPWLSPPPIHLDLCPLLRRLGLKGGLKRIEKTIGLCRPEDVSGLDGYQAVLLWQEWCRGKTTALERLVCYNREDVLNLALLADLAYKGLRELTLTGQIPALTVSSGNKYGGESHEISSDLSGH